MNITDLAYLLQGKFLPRTSVIYIMLNRCMFLSKFLFNESRGIIKVCEVLSDYMRVFLAKVIRKGRV